MSNLWHHQEEAVKRLLPLSGAGLFCEMGTGKTLTAIELLNRWQVSRALIVSPKAVTSVWESEFAKHAPQWQVQVLNQVGTYRKLEAAQRFVSLTNGRPAALVVNYESVWRDPLGKWLLTYPIDAVICDESHRIKAPGGIASRFMSRLGQRVRRRLALTGTPLSHSPLDAYAQYRFLNPQIFGFSFTRFRSRYALMGGYGGHQVLKFVNLDDLHQRMYSIAYRTTAADVLDLPETLDQTILFDLEPKTMKVYKDLERDLLATLEDGREISVPNVLAKLVRLQQLTGGWLKWDDGKEEKLDGSKGEALQDLLEGMGEEPVVVFCRFLRDLETVRQVCKGLGLKSCELSGKMNEVTEFTAGKAQVIACQIRSGSLGIDLTRARYCVFFSIGYSLGDYMQARARVHRPGQTRPVTYYHLAARKTIDEKILQGLEKRAELVQFIVDEMRRK